MPEYLVERLRSDGSKLVLSVDVGGDYAQRQLLTDLADAFRQGANLVQGGVEHIQVQPMDGIFLTLPAQDALLVDQVKFRLAAANARVEVLNHV